LRKTNFIGKKIGEKREKKEKKRKSEKKEKRKNISTNWQPIDGNLATTTQSKFPVGQRCKVPNMTHVTHFGCSNSHVEKQRPFGTKVTQLKIGTMATKVATQFSKPNHSVVISNNSS